MSQSLLLSCTFVKTVPNVHMEKELNVRDTWWQTWPPMLAESMSLTSFLWSALRPVTISASQGRKTDGSSLTVWPTESVSIVSIRVHKTFTKYGYRQPCKLYIHKCSVEDYNLNFYASVQGHSSHVRVTCTHYMHSLTLFDKEWNQQYACILSLLFCWLTMAASLLSHSMKFLRYVCRWHVQHPQGGGLH